MPIYSKVLSRNLSKCLLAVYTESSIVLVILKNMWKLWMHVFNQTNNYFMIINILILLSFLIYF